MEQAVFAFVFPGTPVSCVEFGSGHINTTLKITTDEGKEYVLQMINKNVFAEPEKVIANAGAVTEFLRSHSSDPYASLHYLTTREGKFFHLDKSGNYWRMYEYIPGFGLDAPQSDEDFYQSALAYGRFQNLLTDFPAETLHETIPQFHNTVIRYQQLKQSIAADSMGRAREVQEEIAFLLSREEKAGTLQRMLEAGELPLRVTHNDTKLNNVLLDLTTRKSLCVLDLDTVMPGLSVLDFGDSIRFGAATCAEDEQDPGKVHMDLHLFEVYTRGDLEAAPNLTDTEVAMLPMGALVITLELATRFLKDYLDGDIYFRIRTPDQNRIRARNQILLAADMERKLPEMERIVREVRSQTCNTWELTTK